MRDIKVKVHPSKSNLKKEDQLAWKIAEISSDKAKYNYSSQDSKFYKNVEIKYDGKIITCDSLDLLISENIAVAYNNVMIKDENSLMKAQVITLDILTKDIKINSEDKVKVFTK